MNNQPTVDDILSELGAMEQRLVGFLIENRVANGTAGFGLAGPASQQVHAAVRRLVDVVEGVVPELVGPDRSAAQGEKR
jgi:hypothetical protein